MKSSLDFQPEFVYDESMRKKYEFLMVCPFIKEEIASVIFSFYESLWPLRWKFYHNINHIKRFFFFIENDNSIKDKNLFYLAAAYHDIYYSPIEADNETKSCEIFLEHFKNQHFISEDEIKFVIHLIMATKGLSFDHLSDPQKSFKYIDFRCAAEESPILYENGVSFENQHIGYENYKEKRKQVLSMLPDYFKKKEIIDYIESRKIKKVVYPGSFNPFHIGHQQILKDSLENFDFVDVAIGINEQKINEKDFSNIQSIKSIFPYVNIFKFNYLFAELVERNKYDIVVKGIRNIHDYDYEMNQFKINQELLSQMNYEKELKLILIPSNKEIEHVSSSLIRTMIKMGKSYHEKYLPVPFKVK